MNVIKYIKAHFTLSRQVSKERPVRRADAASGLPGAPQAVLNLPLHHPQVRARPVSGEAGEERDIWERI